MGQSATAPTEAFLESYYQGYTKLRELQNKPLETITTDDLHEVGEHLMDAIEADPGLVQPYVLLAALFFTVEQQPMVTKYIDLAEKIDPEFPGLLILKEYISTPSNLRAKYKHPTSSAPLPIERIGRMRQPDPKADTAEPEEDSGFSLLSFPDV